MSKKSMNFPRPSNFEYDEVFYSDGEIAIMLGYYKKSNTMSLGLRWLVGESKLGYPNIFGKAVWMVVPDKLAFHIIKGLHNHIHLEKENILDYKLFLEAYIYLHQGNESLESNSFNRNCPLLSNLDDNYLHMLISPNMEKKGISKINKFTKSAEKLIIIDPYIFSGNSENSSRILKHFKKTTRICKNNIKSIHIIYNENNVTNTIKRKIEKEARECGIKLTSVSSDKMHDRIWIADRKKGLLVGTSLNGLGNKAAFILDLPHSDLLELIEYIDEQGLSRNIHHQQFPLKL